MLKRLYADNFRCFENFEVRFSEANLLLGRSGTGKTSVLDVLGRLRDLITRSLKVDQVFPAQDRSYSQLRNEQRFELETETGEDRYTYELVVQHALDIRKMRIAREVLRHNERAVFEFDGRLAQLYRDDYTTGPMVPFDWSQSGVGFLTARPDNQKVSRFKQALSNYVIASTCPPVMRPESRTEDEFLDPLMRNFVGWYRRAAQENMAAISPLFDALKDAIPGFSSINLAESGENSCALKVLVSTPAASRVALSLRQLSDGQRALVALYSLLHLLSDKCPSIFIDEPENYLAPAEVQPWLAEALQSCGDSIEQLVVISHHPVTIDYMAGAYGLWFSRDGAGPARVTAGPAANAGGLPTSEIVARGWE